MVDQFRFSARQGWSLMALLAIAATCVVFAAMPNRASAADGTYCWGTWLQGHNWACTYGGAPDHQFELVGSGKQHSVCTYEHAGNTECSPGPNQAVYNTSMAGCSNTTDFCGFPGILNNGYDWNQVYGHWYASN